MFTKRILVAIATGVLSGCLVLFVYQELFVIADNSPITYEEKFVLMAQSNPSFDRVSDFFIAMAQDRGAVAAFALLINGNLPANIDTHLVGHFVGDILYEQQGVDGLQHCTADIGFACAHSIVINALFDKGAVVFDEINFICSRVDGPNGYGMCFHGFGHGVLAYAEYELPEAITACGQVGTQEHNNWEEQECLGGIIMEMRDGLHNPVLWERNGKQYLNKDDPLTMCQASYMPEEYRDMCFIYATPFLFDAVTLQDIPEPEHYADAMHFCEQAPDKYNEACYGGFAKEFLGFILGRDIRKVGSLTDSQLKTLHDACYVASNQEKASYCQTYAVYNLYRSGLHSYNVPARFCGMIEYEASRSSCQTLLEDEVVANVSVTDYAEFCVYMKENYDYTCKN